MNKYLIILFALIFSTISFYLLFNGLTFQNKYERFQCLNCNVILISIDTLRADHLGSYGYFRNTSPNIDEFAKESVLFKNCFSQSSYTISSHMSIFTSLYPSSHRVITPPDSLNPNITTLAQVLKENGYNTTWYGTLNDSNLNLKNGFGNGFENFIEISRDLEEDWTKGLGWIRENKDEKFFVFLHTFKVHDPYIPSVDTILRFTNKTNEKVITSEEKLLDITWEKIITDPSIAFKKDAIKENELIFNNKSLLKELLPSLCRNKSIIDKRCGEVYKETFWENVNLSSDSDMDYVRLLYDSTISEVDQNFETLIDMLKAEKLINKTVIIITSDHGEEFMEHGGIGHSKTLYDEVIHVPLIIWIPNTKGKEVSPLVQSVDIMPTVLDLVGIDALKQVQGRSVLPLIEGKIDKLNDYVYSETPFIQPGNVFSIRSRDWKCITNFRDFNELFNLKNDPVEKINLVENETKVVEQMKIRLEEHSMKNVLIES